MTTANWNSVKERLPEPGKLVRIKVGQEETEGRWNGKAWTHGGFGFEAVTHWKPIVPSQVKP